MGQGEHVDLLQGLVERVQLVLHTDCGEAGAPLAAGGAERRAGLGGGEAEDGAPLLLPLLLCQPQAGLRVLGGRLPPPPGEEHDDGHDHGSSIDDDDDDDDDDEEDSGTSCRWPARPGRG